MNKTAFIIQARTGSTRMPNKILLPFYNEKSILELLLEKLSNNFRIPVILATTTSQFDDPIQKVANNIGVKCFRGSESDVLDRFINAAEFFNVENIIRICSDNPFLSVRFIQNILDNWTDQTDYLSFQMKDGTPSIRTHYGLFTEMVSLKCLKKVQQRTNEMLYHEHVTNYIYDHSDAFNLKFIPIPDYLQENKQIRLTLDTPNDFKIQQDIYAHLMDQNPKFGPNEIFSYLNNHPDLVEKMKKEIIANTK